jgi:hypothetical protein
VDSLLLQPEIQRFISNHIDSDISQLALQKNPFQNVDYKLILNQIVAKQKAKTKLPSWFNAQHILYPQKVSVEQTSSEITAKYKSKLISGHSLIDMTGGFGVDDYFFAQHIKKVIHCEIDNDLSKVVQHNFEQLKIKNISCFSGDSQEIVKQFSKKFDWLYLDPSRRSESKGKVFLLKDCLPNVPDLIDFYFEFTDNLMIKTAPILDIDAGLFELKYVQSVHVVAVENEVKELLWILQKNLIQPLQIVTVNILKDKTETFTFEYKTAKATHNSFPKKYLFEPNAAIMKSGGFNEIGTVFSVDKLHPHSHLYTSNELMAFPGRIFEIEHQFPYTKNEMKAFLENKKANITTRNFPDSVATIRKKWKIKDGGNTFCFFTTNKDEQKIVLLCNKIK